jgi:nuclear pore complex protein Nup133
MLRIFVRQVIQGKVLNVEDVVDVLTLHDDEGVENYATALHLLAHAEVWHTFMAAVHRTDGLFIMHKDIPDTR